MTSLISYKAEYRTVSKDDIKWETEEKEISIEEATDCVVQALKDGRDVSFMNGSTSGHPWLTLHPKKFEGAPGEKLLMGEVLGVQRRSVIERASELGINIVSMARAGSSGSRYTLTLDETFNCGG